MGRVGHGPPKILVGRAAHNAFSPANNWPVCSLILRYVQLILRKISKIGASRYQTLRLKCTKFTFCWGSAKTLLGKLTVPPKPLPLFKGPTSKGMEGNARAGRKGKGEGRGEVEGGIWPTQKFWCGALYARRACVVQIIASCKRKRYNNNTNNHDNDKNNSNFNRFVTYKTQNM